MSFGAKFPLSITTFSSLGATFSSFGATCSSLGARFSLLGAEFSLFRVKFSLLGVAFSFLRVPFSIRKFHVLQIRFQLLFLACYRLYVRVSSWHLRICNRNFRFHFTTLGAQYLILRAIFMEDAASKPSILPVESLTRAIGSPLRWRILAELSLHEPLMVSELADSLGHTMSNISKQIAILRETGAVEQIRGRMYAVPARYVVSHGVLDFGYGPFQMKPTRPAA